jgi:hypothetical protein
MSCSPVTGLFCHRHLADIVLSLPGWADRTPQNLTPASGRQDHTILPSAKSVSRQRAGESLTSPEEPALRSHRAQNAAASTASHPRVRDDHDTPLFWGGTRKVLDVIWGEWEQKYFRKIRNKTRQPCQETARRANHLNQPCCQRLQQSHPCSPTVDAGSRCARDAASHCASVGLKTTSDSGTFEGVSWSVHGWSNFRSADQWFRRGSLGCDKSHG